MDNVVKSNSRGNSMKQPNLRVAFAMALTVLVPASLFASSHREARSPRSTTAQM